MPKKKKKLNYIYIYMIFLKCYIFKYFVYAPGLLRSKTRVVSVCICMKTPQLCTSQSIFNYKYSGVYNRCTRWVRLSNAK